MRRVWHTLAAGCLVAASVAALPGCSNSPYEPGAEATNTLFTAFTERSPRHLDPTASYWSNETPYTYNIYEPLYGYHYLQRPYRLGPKAAAEVVKPRYLDAQGRPLPADAPAGTVAESVYDIPIRRGILYQPHPAFARGADGRPVYHHLSQRERAGKHAPSDFAVQGTRELVADDFVYAIKRHATPRTTAPVFGVFAQYVLGLKEYAEQLRQADAALRREAGGAREDAPFLDLRRWPLAGASAPDPHLLRIRLKGRYPQWSYWMAMSFLAPVPWEADAFYSQPGFARAGLSLDRWPVGTGPYMMAVYEADRQHVLVRNPNYRREPYPCEGEATDQAAGRLADCGRPTPFIERIVFRIEKEGVPLKAKFRQGWLDVPQLERDDWGVALRMEMEDSPDIAREYTEHGLQLSQSTDLSVYYLGFNMLDPVVGWGDTPEQRARHRTLRQALCIAIDWEERARVFPKDAGAVAMSPLPVGLFGSREGTAAGVNPVTHRWIDGHAVRRPLDDARRLMAEAGYPGGRDATTGQPLVLNYDYYGAPTPETRASLDWMVRQFAKLGVVLEIRATDNNQYQEKVRHGRHQIYFSGWLADYPDAENFLFQLYGPNGKSVADGENTSNYRNPAFDRLFDEMRELDDGPRKQAVIDQLVHIVQEDAPWSFGYFPFSGGAYQRWLHNAKPSSMVRDNARYLRLDVAERARLLSLWNAPRYAGLLAVTALLLALAGVAWRVWRRLQGTTAIERAQALGLARREG